MFGFKRKRYVTVPPSAFSENAEPNTDNCAECPDSSVCHKATDAWHGEQRNVADEWTQYADMIDEEIGDDSEMPTLTQLIIFAAAIFTAIGVVAYAIARLLVFVFRKGDAE
jgi:hypothetical protein